MRLVALKDLSEQLPAGTVFDWRDDHAPMLITAGIARAAEPADEEPKAKRTYRRRDFQAEGS